jgi:hypothetical protein
VKNYLLIDQFLPSNFLTQKIPAKTFPKTIGDIIVYSSFMDDDGMLLQEPVY